MAKTETAEKTSETTDVAVRQELPPALYEDMAQYAGAGVSERAQDFLLPFLAIAQSNSPQVKKQQVDKYIKGLEPGDIFNTATGEFWPGSTGIQVIQAWFEKSMVEWIPRADGGGWVATHPVDTPLTKTCQWSGPDRRHLTLPNGHQLVETAYHFVINPENGDESVVSMASTSLGCSRQWQTLMKKVKIPAKGDDGQPTLVIAPGFSRVYRLRTAYRSNEKGDWFLWTVSDEGWAAGQPQFNVGYHTARKFFLQAREKGVQMGRPPVELDEGTAGSTIDGEEPPI